MSNAFASKKNAIADCDVCGFQFKLTKLKSLVIRTTKTEILACPECWNPDQPQNLQGMYPVTDPQAIQDPRPDKSFVIAGPYSSRDIQWGWGPVGLSNPLQLEGLENNLLAQGQTGIVTVDIT